MMLSNIKTSATTSQKTARDANLRDSSSNIMLKITNIIHRRSGPITVNYSRPGVLEVTRRDIRWHYTDRGGRNRKMISAYSTVQNLNTTEIWHQRPTTYNMINPTSTLPIITNECVYAMQLEHKLVADQLKIYRKHHKTWNQAYSWNQQQPQDIHNYYQKIKNESLYTNIHIRHMLHTHYYQSACIHLQS